MQQMQQAEVELLGSENDPAHLYDNAPCGYHSFDAGGVVIRMNDTELGWLGYSRADKVSKVRFLGSRIRATPSRLRVGVCETDGNRGADRYRIQADAKR